MYRITLVTCILSVLELDGLAEPDEFQRERATVRFGAGRRFKILKTVILFVWELPKYMYVEIGSLYKIDFHFSAIL